MTTSTGRVIDLASAVVDPSVIDLADIAGGLSRICRFAGQTTAFYSVAQHSVLVSNIVETDFERPDLAFEALHHDSHEAYLGDVPAPMRGAMTELETRERQIRETRFDVAIHMAFGIVPATACDDRVLIKTADRTALLVEAAAVLGDHGSNVRHALRSQGVAPPTTARVLGALLGPEEAEAVFRGTHHRLVPG